jgi:hypothetical protein
MREKSDLRPLEDSTSVAHTMRALDVLESGSLAASILRRFYLAQLVEYKRKHVLLKTRLTSGRNCFLMQQRFSPGVLALMCFASDDNLRNNE